MLLNCAAFGRCSIYTRDSEKQVLSAIIAIRGRQLHVSLIQAGLSFLSGISSSSSNLVCRIRGSGMLAQFRFQIHKSS
jgi:hypothetical protein